MIDFNAFFKYLWRYKWLVVAAIIISAVTTYFLAENLPDQYKSQAQIAAHSPQLFNQQAGASTGGYGDIAQMMQMRRVLNLLSYRLILHDLEHPSEAFRPFPEEMADWVLQNREELILEFKRRLYDKSILTIKDNQPLRLFDLVNWMGYGEGAFSDALTVEQGLGNNLTKVEFISENPALSVFAVNTLSSEFIRYYHTITVC